MGSYGYSKSFDSYNNNKKSIAVPGWRYWLDRLVCKGCNYPLYSPVYYCQGNQAHQRSHLLCRNCSFCAVEGCKSKVSQQRCPVIEKVLRLASFSCEFKCTRGPFEGEEYKAHVMSCHMRPLVCAYCKTGVQFRGYVNHLIVQHGMTEAPIHLDTVVLNFANGQPAIQYVVYNDATFLLHYEGGKLWVELWSEEENAHVDYRVHASGVKYQLDFELAVLCARSGREVVRRSLKEERQGSCSTPDVNQYAVPPPNEELTLQFIYEDDGNTISSFNDDCTDDGVNKTAYV